MCIVNQNLSMFSPFVPVSRTTTVKRFPGGRSPVPCSPVAMVRSPRVLLTDRRH